MIISDVSQKGKASVEKPWLQFYPKELHDFRVPYITINDFLKQRVANDAKPVLEYYGCVYSLKDIFNQVDLVAKSLAAMGIKKGDHILVFTRAVPEFIFMLLAAEKIGAAIICRSGTQQDLFEAIEKSKGAIAVVHDYISREKEELFYSAGNLKSIITISPYTYGDKNQMPDYILKNIENLYPEQGICNNNTITWNDFINKGTKYVGNYEAEKDPRRPLYHSYTSGASGPPKEIIHAAVTIVGIISQLVLFSPPNITLKCLLTILPPSLIAVVSPIILYSIASSSVLILSPFCELKDLDLEFMYYRPNQLIAIPMMADAFMKSKRIPEDYSMDFLYVIGGGADPMNNKWFRKIQSFLKKHNSPAVYSMCYGMSEAGSAATNPHQNISFFNCGGGIPMIGTTISIFEKDTCRELDYGEIGEICVNSSGSMIGYSSAEETAKTIIQHDDEKLWIHTGDYGYMNENGELYVMGRGLTQRYGGGNLFVVPMENRVVEVAGIDDCFFVLVPDEEHERYFLPYLYVILEKEVLLQDVESEIYKALQPHEQPVLINVVCERKYLHFKLNRRELVDKIISKQKA